MSKNTTADRFGIDLTDVSTERVLVPTGEFTAKAEKAVFSSGSQKENADAFWYSINVQYAIKDDEVAKVMQQDSPKAFWNVFISTDKETGKVATANPDFGMLLKASDLDNADVTSMCIEAASSAETQHDFNKLFLGKIAELVAGSDQIVKVIHRKKSKDDDTLVAAVTKAIKA